MKKRILLVDDEQITCYSLSLKLSKQGYEVVSESRAGKAMQRLKNEEFDLIILDVVIPDMNGIETFEQIKNINPDMPVIMLSGKASTEKAVQLMKMGAYDYITKPVGQAKEVGLRVERALEKNQLIIQNRGLVQELKLANMELELDKNLLEEKTQHLQRALEGTVDTLASMVEMKDLYTAGHQCRVANLACAIAREMRFPGEEVEAIHTAGVIHDIGKVCIPAEILSKPSKLNEAEMSLVKRHPGVAYNILKEVEFSWPIAKMVYQHHERMDGSGYPNALSLKDICAGARILAVADVVEAMTSHRPYRPALGIDKALEEISRNKGILYDPDVVDACLRLFTEKGFKFDYEAADIMSLERKRKKTSFSFALVHS